MKSLFVYLFPGSFCVKCLCASLSKECFRNNQSSSQSAGRIRKRTCLYPQHPVPCLVYNTVNLMPNYKRDWIGDWSYSAQLLFTSRDWQPSNSALPRAASGTSSVTPSQPTFHGYNEDFGVSRVFVSKL